MKVSIAIVLFVSSFVAALANVDQMREGVQKGGTGGGVGGASSGSPIEATAPATTGSGTGTPTIGTGTGVGATTGGKLNATQCIYKPEEKTLSCQSDSETFVECPTIGEWSMLDSAGSHKFQIFGLSTPRCMMSAGECPPQSTVFWLHPRKPDNETYSSHTIVSNKTGKAVDMMLWGSGSSSSSGVVSGEPAMAGLRVSDVKCFERLVKLNAETCRTPRTFSIVHNATASEEVTLCGEILVADKALQKRWFGWGGLGLWGWGWPYWGFGAPLLWGR